MFIATVIVVVVADAVLGHVHSRIALGGLVILISLAGFYTTLRLDHARLEKQRYTRGQGWWLGLAISKLPLTAARLVWLAISLGILALGIAEIAGA